MSPNLTRRDLFAAAGASAAALALGPFAAARTPLPRPGRRRVLRIAHLTDVHVQPERRAGEGLAACLRHVRALTDPPNLIITGGDCVMDSFEADAERTRVQWDLWKRVWRDECTTPVRSCVGNHDVWGWGKSKSKATGGEPLYGKRMAEEMLLIPKRYYSFDQAGWHVVILDSVFQEGEGYLGMLDDEQFEWLKGDLAGVNAETPILVVSHIPILSACAVMYKNPAKDKNFHMDGGEMHLDVWKLKDLFLAHPNVKLCLSGHIHLVDRVDYNGVTYLCNGAVSANWWKGRHQRCDEGYGLVDLFDDGTFGHEYVTYGWKAENSK